MANITWRNLNNHRAVAELNGWAATVVDYEKHPRAADLNHIKEQRCFWGIRPAGRFDNYTREGFSGTPEAARAAAEKNLRELANQKVAV